MITSPTERRQFPSEPELQNLPRPGGHNDHDNHCGYCHAGQWGGVDWPPYADGCCCCYGHFSHGGGFMDA